MLGLLIIRLLLFYMWSRDAILFNSLFTDTINLLFPLYLSKTPRAFDVLLQRDITSYVSLLERNLTQT
jgi:hypothetical protein